MEEFYQECTANLSAAADDSMRFYALGNAAKASLATGRIEEARGYALELNTLKDKFPSDWNYGNAVEVSNTVLGRIAMNEGDVEVAKNLLLEAGKGPTSPQIMSEGPDMTLAVALLHKGERSAVLQYLEFCEEKWKTGSVQLKKWNKQIREGKQPDFSRD